MFQSVKINFVIEKRQQGMTRHQVIIQSDTERAHPILMTTITMIAGMVPTVFASG
ncbi:efflux RND transporter permease subunit [Gallibacterium anatis]|uniref:efflux RND transporter permease subunit n=1 Tax=Gallibacterium anatis TaxID=750 RepID=UPI0027957202|nr:efflux RND transporter permease subunit [Gallibacterium anatis]